MKIEGHLSRLTGGDLFPQRSYQLEGYVAEGMTAFDCPGLAIGIISSVTKGFLATTLAIAVDRGKFRWDLWP